MKRLLILTLLAVGGCGLTFEVRRPTAREKCRDWGFPHEDIAILFSLTRGHRRSGFSAAELNVSAMSLCADVYAGSGNVQGLSDCDGCVLAIIDEVLAE